MSPSGAEVLRQIKDRIEEVDPAAVRDQLQTGALVIDVRQDEEWANGHIPGAHHVPKSHLESGSKAQHRTRLKLSCSIAHPASARPGPRAR
jgi:rhodanese-related sulfurtransferase